MYQSLCKFVYIVNNNMPIPFEYTAINRFNHTSWVAVITQTDRPKSVCSHVIVVFGGIFV